MPRPILKPVHKESSFDLLRATPSDTRQKLNAEEKLRLERALRKPRSKQYISAFQNLDGGGHENFHKNASDLIQILDEELPQLQMSGILLGIVATCYLGAPYEVHILDMSGKIVHHYKYGEPLPGRLEKARGLALRGGYPLIEVYADCCRAVSSNGTVSVIPD